MQSVILNEHVNWKTHIDSVSRKISKSIGVIGRVKQFFPKRILLALYNSLILPYLQYGNIIWGSDYPSNLVKLYNLQKRVIRIITSSPYRCNAEPLFHQHNLLNIYDINKVQVGCFMYKHTHKMLPKVFNDLFQCKANVHNYRTRQCNMLRIPFVRLTKSQFSICVHGPNVWNHINSKLKTSNTLMTFRKLLKKEIISNYQ